MKEIIHWKYSYTNSKIGLKAGIYLPILHHNKYNFLVDNGTSFFRQIGKIFNLR